MASSARATLLLSLAGAAALAVALAAVPAVAGDAQKGGVIAKRWCASCHVVAGDQATANADAPSFFDLAKRRDKKQIANFLVDPHPPMPDMHLSRKEIDDIATYIRSLDPRPQPKGEPDGKDEELPKKG